MLGLICLFQRQALKGAGASAPVQPTNFRGGYATLSRKEKFLAAAKEFEVDETDDAFLKSLKTISIHKNKESK